MMGSKKFKKRARSKKIGRLVKIRKSRLNGRDHVSETSKFNSVDNFSQIRENYFNYLQNVIKENLESAKNGNLPNESLERISLEVEQKALLACMQSDVYQRIMVKIIHDIKKSTHKMELYLGIRNIMSSQKIEINDILCKVKKRDRKDENTPFVNSIVPEVYSHIPTISSFRTQYIDYDHWSDENDIQSHYESHMSSAIECEDRYLQTAPINVPLAESCEAQDVMQVSYSPYTDDQYFFNSNSEEFTSTTSNLPNNWVQNLLPDKPAVNRLNNSFNSIEDESYFSQNLVPVITTNSEDNLQSTKVNKTSVNAVSPNSNEVPTLTAVTLQETDPILKSRNELQKSVEKTLKNLKEINMQKQEERERAEIAKILEGNFEDGTDENEYDSLSDNYEELMLDPTDNDVRNESLLSDRLEEMRQLFGMEDEEINGEKVLKGSLNCGEKLEAGKTARRKLHKHISVWYHERIIQMHRFALLASEMTEDMRIRNRDLFLELFEEDSDEENETDFYCEDKYLTSCKERISSWVVKYLMPYYNKKRIVGRNVFKSLGHHISNSIIEKIQYPDEWTVKYLVNKFFPTDKQFKNEYDVWCFQIQ